MPKKTPLKITIRDYRLEDYPHVRENLEDGCIFSESMDSEKRLAKKIERNPGSILVAVVDGRPVGNVFVVEDGWEAFLYRLSVRNEYRRQGIGKALMLAIEKRLKKRGYDEVHLLVHEKNEALREYYFQMGYEPGHVYRWMVKDLSA